MEIVRTTAERRRVERLCILYPRGVPCLYHLVEELRERCATVRVAPSDWPDFARTLVGRAPYDPTSPHVLPCRSVKGVKQMGAYGPVLSKLAKRCDTIIFTRPDQAPLLPSFSDKRRVFYVTDDFACYHRDWLDLENSLLAECDHVITVSASLRELVSRRSGVDAGGIFVSPNAFPHQWIPETCPDRPVELGSLPPRPIAGVLGTISSRLRLDWLVDVVKATPFLNWLFAGEIEETELHDQDRPALAFLRAHPRCFFVGPQSYRSLVTFAASVDVAVLAYSPMGVNPFGSPMRLFMQLPFGQPILATPGCLALEAFAPLVSICHSPSELIDHLESLHGLRFSDGLCTQRWEAARKHTWSMRAKRLIKHLDNS